MGQLHNFHTPYGEHAETACVYNILKYKGVRAPHTGEPFSEAMLLGIGGGIGLAYWVFESNVWDGPIFFLGMRWYGDFLAQLFTHLDISVNMYETNGAKTAAQNLATALETDNPPIVLCDPASLSYNAIHPALIKWMLPTPILVTGLDEQTAQIADRASVLLTIPVQELVAARAAQPGMKHKMMTLNVGKFSPSLKELQHYIRLGIQACIAGLTEAPIKNFGLPALAKWADLMTHPKDKKGWPKVFGSPAYFYDALKSIYTSVEQNTGGGAMRLMYADFLHEAADIMELSALKQAESQYRYCAELWTTFAMAELPDASPDLQRTRHLLARRYVVFKEHGMNGLAEIQQINIELDGLKQRILKMGALDEDTLIIMRDGLRAHIEQIYAAEAEAVRILQTAFT